MKNRMACLWVVVLVIAATVLTSCIPAPQPTPKGIQSLPNKGQQISPLAPQGSTFEPLNPGLADNPNWLAGQAATTVVSPDKKTLLVLTSGYNRVFRTDNKIDAFGTYFNWPDSQEYVFVYDITTDKPVKKQVIMVPNQSVSKDNENRVYVFIVDPAAKRARKQVIIPGQYHDSGLEVLSGLAPGQMIVNEGKEKLSDNSLISF